MSQVMYSGSGSGKTIKYIISQSSIIQAYRTCIEDVEGDYHVPDKTLHHTSPDIQSRLDGMRDNLRKLRPHKYEKGRTAPSRIADYFQKGCQYFHRGLTWQSAAAAEGGGDDEMYNVEAVDLGT